MAIIKCPRCGAIVAGKQETCTNCGVVLPKPKEPFIRKYGLRMRSYLVVVGVCCFIVAFADNDWSAYVITGVIVILLALMIHWLLKGKSREKQSRS